MTHVLGAPSVDQLSRERAEFEEAASSPGQLTIDELLSFRHPESSHSRLLDTVNELVETLGELPAGCRLGANLLEMLCKSC